MGYVNFDKYPNEFALHKKYAQSPLILDLVWTHCNIIADISLELLKNGKFDTSGLPQPTVATAALVHDIGVYTCGGFEWVPGQSLAERPYVHHTLAGGEILRQEGYDEIFARVAEVHTGVGLTAQDITTYGLPLPAQDFVPATPLEWLITYTAKFHSKAPKFKTVLEIRESLCKYGEQKMQQFDQLHQVFGEPDLDALKFKYQEWHNHFQFDIEQAQSGNFSSVASLPKVELSSAGISQSVPTVTIEAPTS